ncbi:ISL3 family transposase, partial [Sulfobacillus sp. hq2]|uniref:ISL3 family transposase n=2 Tax=Sulfobacillus TaxID=28033 RepID=UPI0011AF7C8E
WVPAYGRRSMDLTDRIEDWGWHLSAEALARLVLKDGVKVSATTILRVLRTAPDPVWEAPRVVGIDDWALRKGHTYATVIVDLERHHIVDVLPDRQPETVAQWLIAHPGITVVSRDRAKGYGKAIRDGAPGARQIADRWHLLENLSDAIQDVVTRVPPPIRAPTAPNPLSDSSTSLPRGVMHQQERYAEIHALASAGYRVAEIARCTGYDRKTIRKYLDAQDAPVTSDRASSPHMLDTCTPLLERLWADGTRTAKAVAAALHDAGHPVSPSTVTRWLRQRRTQDKTAASPPRRRITRRTWVAWFMVPFPAWPRSATTLLSHLMAASPVYRQVWTLVHQFHTMVTHRHGQALAAWIRGAKASAIPEIVRFAKGLEADWAAVHAGLTESWSQGMTEGFNTQIKYLKRVMFGRADFDLLRARILHNQS